MEKEGCIIDVPKISTDDLRWSTSYFGKDGWHFGYEVFGSKLFWFNETKSQGFKDRNQGNKPSSETQKIIEIEEAPACQNILATEPENVPIAEAENIPVPEPEVVSTITAPVEILAEEHVPVLNDDHDDNSKGDDEEVDANGFNDDDFMFDFEISDDDLRSFFNSNEVDDVVIYPTETEGDTNIFKLPLQTPTQMAEIIPQLDSTARIPPRAVANPNIISSESDLK